MATNHESSPWHDTKEEDEKLEITKKVYHFQGKKTTNSKTLDKWLDENFDVLPERMGGVPYSKIEAVEVEEKTFQEVEE